jgi:F-type H+-transporting ATPase subunit epsilon
MTTSYAHGHGPTLDVQVVTPVGQALATQAEEVTVPGMEGDLGILPGHLPVLAGLRPGIVRVGSGRAQKLFLIGPGYLEAGPSQVIVLTDSCEPADERVAQEIASGVRVLEGFPTGMEPRAKDESSLVLEQPEPHDGH